MKQNWVSLLRDRLVWFVALGLGLFAIDYASGKRLESRILIDLPLVEKLVAQWEGQTKRRPNAQELDALVEGYIREEILVREAKRLGLDDEDVIIRRRLAQKVEFFLDENTPPELPDEAGLQQWFEKNRAIYDTPAKLTWRHIYASDEAQARDLLRQVRSGQITGGRAEDWRALGQPFMLNRAYTRQDQLEMGQIMGADFAATLFDAKTATPAKGWVGPVRSAYGWHLVAVDTRYETQAARFLTIADKVAKDWANDQGRLAKLEAWRELRASYDIELVPVEEK